MTFIEARATVHEEVYKYKEVLNRNFPSLVYKQLLRITDKKMPYSPAIFFVNEWKGWRDYLGSVYFNDGNKQKINSSNSNEKPLFLSGVVEANRFDIKWNMLYIKLQEYRIANGSLIVTKEDKPLQSWVNGQRSLYKRGLLNIDRQKALTKIHFDWETQQSGVDEYIRLISAFKELHGHVDVPNRFNGNHRLGQWVREQRIFFRDGVLRKSTIRQLESMGFRWVIPKEDRFLTLEQRKLK